MVAAALDRARAIRARALAAARPPRARTHLLAARHAARLRCLSRAGECAHPRAPITQTPPPRPLAPQDSYHILYPTNDCDPEHHEPGPGERVCVCVCGQGGARLLRALRPSCPPRQRRARRPPPTLRRAGP